jgi:ABC-2 type transport system ATP-binding protein
LKAGIGKAHLELRLAEGDAQEARAIVSRFGDCLKASNGNVAVTLTNGAADVAPIVRALDDAGLLVESLDVVEPTLDDVFLATTGQTLEGAADDEPEAQPVP